jgi:hypothetical protein
MFLTKMKLGIAAALCACLIGGSFTLLGIAKDAKPKRAETPKELEFLNQYPRFSNLSLDMTEQQFRAFLEQQKLVPQLSIPRDGQLNYSIPLGDGNRLTVMFGLDGRCRGIEPISGEPGTSSGDHD